MKVVINRRIIMKTAAIWFILITVMGAVLSLFASIGLSMPFSRLYIATQITTYLIMCPAVISGYIVAYRLRNKTLPIIILGIMPFSFVAVTIGWGASYIIVQKMMQMVPNFFLYDSIVKIYLPSLILSLIFTCVTPTIEMLRREKEQLQKDIYDISSTMERLDEKYITLKVNGSLYRISHENIIYLSSHGKKTAIHTEKMDYEIPQVMKGMDKALPAGLFVRIHKQYIANINFIARIRHYESGRYWAYLNDEDENTLPVGRKYAPALKKRLEE